MTLFQSKIITGFFFLAAFFFSCNAGPKNSTPGSKTKPTKPFALSSPALDYVCSFTDSIHFEVSVSKKELRVDSSHIFIAGKIVASEIASPLSFSRKNIFNKVGRQSIRLMLYYNDSLTQTLTGQITVLSDIEPVSLRYTTIRSLPHNAEAYIQGLFYYKGYLYEGTGQRGHSKLMKIDPANGRIIMERKLGNEFFGEGIARWNNTIYQLTYQQKLGFIYDLESFEQIREFDLQTMEGWGLTADDKSLIVSDGSSILYFYDPEYFSQVDQLDVCDNKGLATQLNELEYTENNIWANVYGQPYILKIDAATGKVFGRLNLETLFPKDIPRDIDHVLNGIAYNADNNTFFVTGKLWPIMYEIKIIQ